MSDDGSQGDAAYADEGEDSHSDASRQDATTSPPGRNNIRTTQARSREESQHHVADERNPNVTRTVPFVKKEIRKHREVYREFFNRTIEEVTGQHLWFDNRGLEPSSLIGASEWTSMEKEVFFYNLPILGRDNIKGIAAAIGSKSESEVHQYILLLSQGVIEGDLTQSLDVLLPTNIPAANEISVECEAVLEIAADVLAEDQLKWDKESEVKKHGEYWILNDEVAEKIEETLDAARESNITDDQTAVDDKLAAETADVETAVGEDEEGGTNLPVPAAELLNLSNWLELSRHFMWQGQDSSENWTELVNSKDETPSIYNTAFKDFHNLTLSLTRRLVQATIFHAQSRIRARDYDAPSRTVYGTDVRAAAEVLNLRSDRRRFWGTMPRRHGLKVYVREEKKKQRDQSTDSQGKEYHYGNLKHMSYDEVETRLKVRKEESKEENEPLDGEAMETVEDEMDPIDIYDDSDMWTEVSYIDEGTTEIDKVEEVLSDDEAPDDRTFHPTHNPNAQRQQTPMTRGGLDKRALEKQMNAESEAFDQQASAIEEAQLWGLLNIPPPVAIKDEEPKHARSLCRKRKSRNELKDWRDAVEYEADWERDMAQIPVETFETMHKRGQEGRKRRRLAYDDIGKNEGKQRRPRRSTHRIAAASDEEDSEESIAASEPREASPPQYEHVAWSPGVSASAPAPSTAKRINEAPKARPPPPSPAELAAARLAGQKAPTARSFLNRRTREKSSASRRSSVSNTSKQMPGSDAATKTEQVDEDEDMEDGASDSHSDSSSDVEMSKMVQSKPSKPSSETESDGMETGYVAEIRRKKRITKRKQREAVKGERQ